MSVRVTVVAAIALVGVLLLAACGGGGGTGAYGGIASQDDVETATAAGDAADPGAGEGAQAAGSSAEEPAEVEEPAPVSDNFEDNILAFAGCLRGEGIEVADPDFSGGGGPGGGLLRQLDQDDPDVQAALQECQPLLGAVGPGADPELQTQRQDSALAFAQCLRDQGLDVADPDFSGGPGGGGGGGLFGALGVDQDDPEVEAAIETCRDELPAFGGGPGGGGGPGQ